MLAAAGAVAASAALAVPAHAAGFTGPCSPGTGKQSAVTALTNRPDSGGGGTWALDGKTPRTPLTRTLSVTLISHAAGVWDWQAAVCDGGSFTAIPGALAPNQGPGHAGDVIAAPAASGSVTGTAFYQFSTDQPLSAARNLGVPASEDGAPVTPAQTTPLWFEQAFPAGTTFTGPGLLDTWSWTYTEGTFVPRSWTDSAADGDGQTPAAEQIT